MGRSRRDANQVTTLIAVSNADGVTPITLYADPTTHRLLIGFPFTIVDSEAPTKANSTTFTLANTPSTGSLHLYLNGVRMRVGATNDYTLSTATITFNTATVTGDVILADYRY